MNHIYIISRVFDVEKCDVIPGLLSRVSTWQQNSRIELNRLDLPTCSCFVHSWMARTGHVIPDG